MISVIIPIYNTATLLDRCLESIQNQTYSDIEVLMINDGSQDNSEEIAKSWEMRDSRFKLISKVNGGVSSARNLGIKKAKGDFICFIDSDDYIEPNMFKMLLQNFKKNSLVVCNMECENASHANSFECAVDFDPNFIKEYFYGAVNCISFGPWNKLFEKKIIDENNINFPETVDFGEDMIFNLHYLSHVSYLKFLNEKLYHYCFNNGSATRSIKDYTTMYEETMCFLEKESFNGVFIDDEVLNRYADSLLFTILFNGFFRRKKYLEFKKYYRHTLSKTRIFYRCRKFNKPKTFKRSILNLVIKSKIIFLLFLLIKLYN